MHPTSIIIIGYVIVILALISVIAYFLKPFLRKLVWSVSGIIFILVIGYFTLLPVLVESQTDDAIEKLNTHLITSYPTESWEISDTDVDKLKETVELHVIFDMESHIVYSYHITNEKIEQLNFWSSLAGESAEELIAKGFKPMHDK